MSFAHLERIAYSIGCTFRVLFFLSITAFNGVKSGRRLTTVLLTIALKNCSVRRCVILVSPADWTEKVKGVVSGAYNISVSTGVY